MSKTDFITSELILTGLLGPFLSSRLQSPWLLRLNKGWRTKIEKKNFSVISRICIGQEFVYLTLEIQNLSIGKILWKTQIFLEIMSRIVPNSGKLKVEKLKKCLINHFNNLHSICSYHRPFSRELKSILSASFIIYCFLITFYFNIDIDST
jgi:hypothetical protein